MRQEYRTVACEAVDTGTLVHKFAENYVAGRQLAMPINKAARPARTTF